MPIMKVTKADSSKKGAPRVYFDGRHDYKDAYYVSQKIQPPPVGYNIEANTSRKDYDGKTYWYLNGWKPLDTSGIHPDVAQEYKQAMNGQTRPKVNGWDIEPGDLSRFVSNLVASAIEKGLILHSEDVFTWVAVGYRAGEQLRSGKVQDFNDVIPTGGLTGPIDSEEPSF